MTLHMLEGFSFSTDQDDYWTYNLITGGHDSNQGIFTGGPFGDNYMAIRNLNWSPRWNFIAGSTSFFYGWRTFIPATAQNGGTTIRSSTGAQQFGAYMLMDGSMTVYRGTTATVILSLPAGTLPVASWFYLELGGVIASGTGGSLIVRVNGTVVGGASGINTQGAADSSIYACGMMANGFSGAQAFTHGYFCDSVGAAPWNTFLGPIRVAPYRPSSDDAVQFVPAGLANNFQNVSLSAPAAADYNASAVVGEQDTFNVGAINYGSILGVATKVGFTLSDGGARSAAAVLKSGGTTSVGSSVALSATGKGIVRIDTLDPNTGTQWAYGAAPKPGYRVTA